jgi:hypothetical protein
VNSGPQLYRINPCYYIIPEQEEYCAEKHGNNETGHCAEGPDVTIGEQAVRYYTDDNRTDRSSFPMRSQMFITAIQCELYPWIFSFAIEEGMI